VQSLRVELEQLRISPKAAMDAKGALRRELETLRESSDRETEEMNVDLRQLKSHMRRGGSNTGEE
jgi:hypothetical protein